MIPAQTSPSESTGSPPAPHPVSTSTCWRQRGKLQKVLARWYATKVLVFRKQTQPPKKKRRGEVKLGSAGMLAIALLQRSEAQREDTRFGTLPKLRDSLLRIGLRLDPPNCPLSPSPLRGCWTLDVGLRRPKSETSFEYIAEVIWAHGSMSPHATLAQRASLPKYPLTFASFPFFFLRG